MQWMILMKFGVKFLKYEHSNSKIPIRPEGQTDKAFSLLSASASNYN